MRVAIVGAGRLGGTLAERLGRHGHEVVVASSRPADQLAPEVTDWPGVTAVERHEVVDADVVILAFPWPEAADALAGLDLADRVVVDATNPFSVDFDVIDTGEVGSTGRIVELLPGARVVKAFNTVPDEQLVERADDRAPTAERIGVPVAGDDVEACDEVTDLIGDLGFTAVRVGGLDDGRDLMQPGCPLFMVPLPAHELEERLRLLQS